MAEVNRIHVSPGVYASETVDMKTAASSIGITKLALVGETLKGPAFQPYWIHSPKEYTSVFGGTSTKKFKGSNYPKYELPYIANEYLKEGTELCVVKTLGLGGYNAGPAWVITGKKGASGEDKFVIAVLRSRGTYKYRPEFGKYSVSTGCPCDSGNDVITFDVGEKTTFDACESPIDYNVNAVSLSQYKKITSNGSECSFYMLGSENGDFNVSYGNLGKFTIDCVLGPTDNVTPSSATTADTVVHIPVSLNKSDNDYIINVLGTTNSDGDQPLYVETLYDVAWADLVENEGFNLISNELEKYNVAYPTDYDGIQPVNDILYMNETELTKKFVGGRYLYSEYLGSPSNVSYHVFNYSTGLPVGIDIDSNYKFTFNEAQTGTTRVGKYVYFQITDGAVAGIYQNTGKGTRISYLCEYITGEDPGPFVSARFVTEGIYDVGYCQEGHIYTVISFQDIDGKTKYVYRAYDNETTKYISNESERINAQDRLLVEGETEEPSKHGMIVYCTSDNVYYKNSGTAAQEVSDGTFTISGGTRVADFEIPARGTLRVKNAPLEATLTDSNTTTEIKRNGNGTWPVLSGNSYTFTLLDDVSDSITYNYIIYGDTNNEITVNDPQVTPITCDLNDYKSQYRYSSTPWVVSNVKGSADNIELNKLFRFHTISDGAMSISEVKVSIEKIRPDSGEFDVVVRQYNDVDASPIVLERFSKCSMERGKNFIGYRIGTVDGIYESKSKYITVEVVDSTSAKNSVPAGFLGYPIPRYNGEAIHSDSHSGVTIAPITYNTSYDSDLSTRKQYFGLSDLSGYDVDYFTFKGNLASVEEPDFVTHGFHLDCTVNSGSYAKGKNAPKITVDGLEGYVFDTVSVNERITNSSNGGFPHIASEDMMVGTIYEDINLRKFTMLFAGGFDGWDVYRDQRSNTDEFSYSDYKGYVNTKTGVGRSFDILKDAASYGIEGGAITSDYYSTLAGVSLLKNPEDTDINLLATPGIDIGNNTKLVNEVFNVLEDRADTFYVVTTPDKESGLGDYAENITPAEEIASDVASSDIYSDYAATYYPWVKIEDDGEYIWLPATRDVVRNLAQSDNTNTTMNLAPAGTSRGRVDAIRARYNLKNSESDALYEANINPVRTYAQEGIVIMGQKTLRQEDDLLNRIDVRRMVLRMRKLIAIGCVGLIFEPYDNNVVKSFKSIISGIMQTFIDNRAIEKWAMDVDDSQEARDRLELGATIYVKPIRALEYITLNFVVTNNDVYFEQ